MNERTSIGIARALFGLIVLLLVVSVVLNVASEPELHTGDRVFVSIISISALLYASIGLLIVARARNRIGWILLAIGSILELGAFSALYAFVGLRSHPGSLPAPDVVAALFAPWFAMLMVSVALMLLVYPTGSPPSARWRPVGAVLIIGGFLSYAGLVVVPKTVNPGYSFTLPNPLLLNAGHALLANALVVVAWPTAMAGISCIWALISRFRHGSAELRQQVKWLGLAVAGALVFFVFSIGSLIACGCNDSPAASVGFAGFSLFVVVGIPTAIAVAVLRYRLYDIDLIIRKTVLYGLLAAFFTAVYIAIVLGVGAVLGSRGNSFLTIAAAIVIAVAFQPARDRARRLADRIVYGSRATPYEILSEFSDRVATTYSADDVLPAMAEILARGTGASSAHVWLRFGHELRETASWPSNGQLPSVRISEDRPEAFTTGEHAVEVRHQGELLGALSVETSPSDPMNPAKAKLVRDLAGQAGLVLRNVRLIEELRASRRRIVTAQDERAKALERNIHDGAQQQLVALGVQLGLAQRRASKEAPAMAELLNSLRTQATEALENLRDLARGIYPPLLADKGLGAALESQVRKSAVPTTLDAESLGRYSQAVESAVYFCVLEALNNVAKYANATRASVRLHATDDALTFEVRDDGIGFRTEAAGFGTGLQGMADRLEAIDGRLEVTSAPGRGTTVSGLITARARDPNLGLAPPTNA